MAAVEGTKRKLPLNLSFFTPSDFEKQTGARKSPRNFEDPTGVAGLGILVALNDHHHHDQGGFFSGSKNAVLAISPKSSGSNPIPILGGGNVFSEKKNREFYSSCVENAIGFSLNDGGGDDVRPFLVSDFLKLCFLCKKTLHAAEMCSIRRGDKAFCSPECRERQISTDEKKEKRQSRSLKKVESPCSSESLKFSAEVVAA
ncbi:hypothetical protein M569_09221 [Genlisea aurea]|uniref:FLZ-type domain-containing protein n=1 Tax=Genlisea aurea TaxID=192259 RepID=S8CLB7_9LAMI|nr:hypothetical protein M569_09221 [Genlisea aurea]